MATGRLLRNPRRRGEGHGGIGSPALDATSRSSTASVILRRGENIADLRGDTQVGSQRTQAIRPVNFGNFAKVNSSAGAPALEFRARPSYHWGIGQVRYNPKNQRVPANVLG